MPPPSPSAFQPARPSDTFAFGYIPGCDLCCRDNGVALYPTDIAALCAHLRIATAEMTHLLHLANTYLIAPFSPSQSP